MSITDEIKQKIDIADVIGQYTKLARSGKTLKGLCPFHSEKHGSFFVYPDQQSWHCFGACGTGGDVFSFVMKKEGCDFSEAKRILAERAGVTLTRDNPDVKERKEKNERLYRTNEAAVEFYHQQLLKTPEADQVRQYLHTRGLNAASVERYRMGYAPVARESLLQFMLERGYSPEDLSEAGLIVESEGKKAHDIFHHRLLFPIADARSRFIGFGGRALDDSLPKYLNTPQTAVFDKKATLFGLDKAKETANKHDCIVIVEGYMDVIIAHQYGFQNVVASMGTAISELHAETIKKITRNVVLALDADSAGEAAMMRSAALENILGTEIRVAILPVSQDPDEFIIADPPAWERLVAGAVPVMDFIFSRVIDATDLKTARGKTQAVEKLMPIISQIKDPVRQAHYLNKLAEATGVASHKLEMLRQERRIERKDTNAKRASADPAILTARPLEEYCLAILVKHPELLAQSVELSPEYFECTENREVLTALRQNTETAKIKTAVDEEIQKRIEALLKKEFPVDKIDYKLSEGILRLREEYLKRLAKQRAVVQADNNLPDESDVAMSHELHRVFAEKEKLNIKKRQK